MNLEKLKQLFEAEATITAAARKYADSEGIEFNDSFRRKCSNALKDFKVDVDLENETVTTDSNNYSNDKEKPQRGFTAIADDGSLLNIEQYCKHYGLDVNKIRSYKLISHSGIPFYNVVFYTSDEEAVLDVDKHLDEVIQKYINPIISISRGDVVVGDEWFDRLVYTDVHINMNVNGKEGNALYEGKWDEEEVLKRLDLMIQHVKTFKKSKTLVITDLGDFLDGLNGQTTRKGHELPQNTNDKDAFELALKFKIKLVDSLIDDFDEIICNNITNDNHAGLFSYFTSSAVEKILMQRYPKKVKVNTMKRFINHHSIGKHTFVELHGKDIGEMRYGFKPKLDATQADKLDQYCKEYKLYNGNYIEVSKGDSHQALYDDATSNDFSYYNYPAFSPPSNWVKTNFGNSRSGFNFFNIKKDENIKISVPFWF